VRAGQGCRRWARVRWGHCRGRGVDGMVSAAGSRRIGNSVRSDKAGQRELEVAMPSGNFVRCPAGAKPVRLRVSPPKPVASLATVSAMGPAKRRHTRVWVMGHAAPKPLIFPDAQGAELLEGYNDLTVRSARRGTYPAGCSTMARTKRTAQAPGRPSPLLDTSWPRGEPMSRLRRTTRPQAHVSSATRHSTSACIEIGWGPAPGKRSGLGAGRAGASNRQRPTRRTGAAATSA
jgi:hypothetical protein